MPGSQGGGRKLAGESMVLLKNDGVLPLKAGKSDSKIALIGPFADSRLLCGSWSMFYEMEDVVTVKEGLGGSLRSRTGSSRRLAAVFSIGIRSFCRLRGRSFPARRSGRTWGTGVMRSF